MAPARLVTGSSVFLRNTSTVRTTAEEQQEILKAQRRNRPESPHLTIYQPQITMILSGLHRITGVAMGGAFYALTLAYAGAGILGVSFDSALLVAAFASLPLVAKVAAKAAMAFPFVFHSFNGVRHLIWDTGRELTIKGVYRTGYVVVALTGVFGTYLTFF